MHYYMENTVNRVSDEAESRSSTRFRNIDKHNGMFEGEASLRLENLQIGSPEKSKDHYAEMPLGVASPLSFRSCGKDDRSPIWKDYPMVQKMVPSTFSYVSASSPCPSSQYVYPGVNYRSSSVASIFGGPKPMISPPKLDMGFTNRYEMQLPLTPLHACCGKSSNQQSWSWSFPLDNNIILSQHSSHLSRSSSQSSGFISQNNGLPTPPPSSAAYLSSRTHERNHRADRCQCCRHDRCCSEAMVSSSSLNGQLLNEVDLSNGGQCWTSSITRKSLASSSHPFSNECSRFGRREVESDSYKRRLVQIRHASSSSSISEDDDDDGNLSFKSAVTSLTQVPAVSGSEPRRRSLNGVRGIRNLRAEIFQTDQDKAYGSQLEQEVKPIRKSSFWASLRQVLWYLSLVLNVFLLIWLIVEKPVDWLDYAQIENVTSNFISSVMSTSTFMWDYICSVCLDTLVLVESRDSGGNPGNQIMLNVNDYEF